MFETEGEGIRTKAFDPAKLVDPSLVIYFPVRVHEGDVIVTNGDQTDTIYEFLCDGGTFFEEALRTRPLSRIGPNFSYAQNFGNCRAAGQRLHPTSFPF